jgi:hypothetical protein
MKAIEKYDETMTEILQDASSTTLWELRHKRSAFKPSIDAVEAIQWAAVLTSMHRNDSQVASKRAYLDLIGIFLTRCEFVPGNAYASDEMLEEYEKTFRNIDDAFDVMVRSLLKRKSVEGWDAWEIALAWYQQKFGLPELSNE